MKELNYALRYGVLSARRELCSINLYLVLLMAFFWIQSNLAGLSGYLADSKGRMNIFELYVHFLSGRSSQIVYLLGILAVSCGTLFYSGGAAYYLIRGNRRRWVLGQAVYLLIATAGYNLFLLFSFCFSTGGRLTLANEWSMASVLAEQFGTRVIGCEGFRVYRTVTEMSPVSAGLLTFLLSMLVGMALGMIMICLGMHRKGIPGIVLIVVAWWADILIENTPGFSQAGYLSPFALSRLSSLMSLKAATIAYATVFFCIIIAIAFAVLLKSAQKVDFMKLE